MYVPCIPVQMYRCTDGIYTLMRGVSYPSHKQYYIEMEMIVDNTPFEHFRITADEILAYILVHEHARAHTHT